MLITSQLPRLVQGEAVSFQFAAHDDTGAVSFAVTEGQLPAGLALSPEGLLTGTLAQAGAFKFTVAATDSASPTPSKAARQYDGIVYLMLTTGPQVFAPQKVAQGGGSSVTAAAPAAGVAATASPMETLVKALAAAHNAHSADIVAHRSRLQALERLPSQGSGVVGNAGLAAQFVNALSAGSAKSAAQTAVTASGS
jgi:hypothetical protein